MRLPKFVATILILMFCIGCKRVQPVPNYFKILNGEYEWSFSTSGELQNADDSNSSYGLKIDKKGFLYTYKDGEQQNKYKLSQYGAENTFETYSKHKVTIKGKLKTYENGYKELIISNFPNETSDISNYFLAHE